MADNDILPIVVFSIFVGVALVAVGDKGQPLVDGIEALVAVMLTITDYVMRVAPIAVFAAIAHAVAINGGGIILTFGRFVGSFYLALAVLWAVLIGAGFVMLGGKARLLLTADPRAGAGRLLDRLVRGRLSASARGAGSLRRAAPDRELRAAAGLFASTSTAR